MKYTDTHKAYYNTRGEEVPSATTLLKIINKPALVKWANYLGFTRRDVSAALEESSILGTMVHSAVEAIISRMMFIFIPTEKFNNKYEIYAYLNSFFNWFNKHEIEPIFQEKEFVNDLYGGTLDFYGKVDGKYTIVDFKTSKQVRLSMFIQLALYCILLEEKGYEVERVEIVLCNPVDKLKAKSKTRKELESYIKFAHKLVEFYHAYYDLNEQTEWSEYIK